VAVPSRHCLSNAMQLASAGAGGSDGHRLHHDVRGVRREPMASRMRGGMRWGRGAGLQPALRTCPGELEVFAWRVSNRCPSLSTQESGGECGNVLKHLVQGGVTS